MTPPFRVAALYRFAPVAEPETLRGVMQAVCDRSSVRGTLLIAHEGVNGTLAGAEADIEAVIATLRAQPGFEALDVKYSTAETMPFHRLKVRIKPEIVTMGRPDVDAHDAGTYVAPEDWNALIADPDTIVIDTRNDYEVAVGTFEGAIDPRTVSFRDFPAWFAHEGRALLNRPEPPRVAMFCTGGIRCEKATALLKAEGVDNVHHLQGGILKYLETVPEADSLWRGECFVFDQRVAVGHALRPGTHTLCHGCRMPVSPQGRTSPLYVEGVCCAACHDRDSDRQAGYAERQRQMQIAARLGIDHVGARLTQGPRSQPLDGESVVTAPVEGTS